MNNQSLRHVLPSSENRKSRLTTFGLLNRANHGKRHVVIASIIGQNDCTEKKTAMRQRESIKQKQTVSIVFFIHSFGSFPVSCTTARSLTTIAGHKPYTLDFFLLRSFLSLFLSLTYQWIWARIRLEYGRKKVLLLFAAAV
jgi:hypothetical protein